MGGVCCGRQLRKELRQGEVGSRRGRGHRQLGLNLLQVDVRHEGVVGGGGRSTSANGCG